MDGESRFLLKSSTKRMLWIVPLVPALLSFTPSMHIGTTSYRVATRLHVQPPRMLIESISTLTAEAFGVLPFFGSVPSTFAALPQELSELAAPAHQKFSHIFLAACGGYTAFSAACTFVPLLTRSQEDDLEQFLANRPESSFGWHNADLRKPLPSTLEELSQMNGFPLGVHKGRRVYLCHIQPERVREAQTHLASFAEIEKSRDFSDFYGETVYVCFEHASGRPTTM